MTVTFNITKVLAERAAGASLPELCEKYDLAMSTLRGRLIRFERSTPAAPVVRRNERAVTTGVETPAQTKARHLAEAVAATAPAPRVHHLKGMGTLAQRAPAPRTYRTQGPVGQPTPCGAGCTGAFFPAGMGSHLRSASHRHRVAFLAQNVVSQPVADIEVRPDTVACKAHGAFDCTACAVETVTAYKCVDCDELSDEAPTGKQYECGECGPFSAGQSEDAGRAKKHMCPECGKFGAKLAPFGCNDCGAEVEELQVFQCASCEELHEDLADMLACCSDETETPEVVEAPALLPSFCCKHGKSNHCSVDGVPMTPSENPAAPQLARTAARLANIGFPTSPSRRRRGLTSEGFNPATSAYYD